MAESSISIASSSTGIQKRKTKVVSIDTKVAIVESLSIGVSEDNIAKQ